MTTNNETEEANFSSVNLPRSYSEHTLNSYKSSTQLFRTYIEQLGPIKKSIQTSLMQRKWGEMNIALIVLTVQNRTTKKKMK